MSESTERGLVHLESDLVPMRRVALLLFAVVVATVASILLARRLYQGHERALETEPRPVRPTAPSGVFHGLIAVERTGQRDAAQARETLASYGWVDRDRGLVRIPIERANELELAALTSGSTPRGGGR